MPKTKPAKDEIEEFVQRIRHDYMRLGEAPYKGTFTFSGRYGEVIDDRTTERLLALKNKWQRESK